MVRGIMEVLLVGAKGLGDTDLFGKMDPYVMIQYRNEECKSKISQGQGGNPVWNERFTFRVQYPGADDQQHKLILKIMDKDTFTNDDFVGQATIHVKDVLAMGVERGIVEVNPSKYRVTREDQTYCGEILVGITFTPKMEEETDQEYGGWVKSSC